MPVRAWLGLPPVFVPTYPCTWIEVQTTAQGATVALWERLVAIQQQQNLVERLLARGPLPTSRAQPAKVIARRSWPTSRPLHAIATAEQRPAQHVSGGVVHDPEPLDG